MTLFVAVHQHAPERCPAGDPSMVPMLLDHLSTANAAKYGVSVQAEAAAADKHTFYVIAEAGDEEQMNQFLAPLHKSALSSCCLPPRTNGRPTYEGRHSPQCWLS
ncbi:MAG TPA: hypothetical protein VIV12_08100, partial [Streptosporangiaceae bacterium]